MFLVDDAYSSRVLLHLMAGSKEDAETVTAFFQDLRARGLELGVALGLPFETSHPISADRLHQARDLLLAERGANPDRSLATALQRYPALTRLCAGNRQPLS